MTKYISIIFTVLLVSRTLAKNTQPFEYGPRPTLAVFDPTGALESSTLKEISEPLRVVYEKEGIDVIIIVLNDVGESPPEHVAGRFADAWCKLPIHCVVLHVPGRKDSPWIIPGGKLIEHLKLEEIKKSVADATRRISSESSEADKVKASAIEAADMLRFWMGNAINQSAMMQKQSEISRQEHDQKKRERNLAMIIAAACAVPLTLGIVIFMMFLHNRKPRIFPDCAITPRLGAPHAGGNYAVTDLGPPTT